LSHEQLKDLAVAGEASFAEARPARRGVETPSGRLTAKEAAIQVLTLPVLILGWGLAVAVIVAFT
jgi:hypothetical protein